MTQVSGTQTSTPRGRGRPKVAGLAESRRDQIVTAAVQVMSSVGYEDASMAQIARVAGIGSATIYRYVGSKRELLDDVFDVVTRQVIAALRPDDAPGVRAGGVDAHDIVDQARLVGARLYELIESDPAMVKLLAIQASAVDKALQERVLRINSMINTAIAASLGTVGEGEIRTRTVAERGVAARIIVGLGLPGAVVALRGGAASKRRRGFVRSMKSVALQGIMTADGVSPVLLARCARWVASGPVVEMAQTSSRRTEILNAALECFVEQSYRETAASAIAERAGVSHGTFYNYFDNRREVVDELIAREERNLLALAEFHRPRPRSAAEFELGLAALVARLIGYSQSHRPALEFLILDAPGVDDRALGALSQLWGQLQWLCEAYVRSGVDDGYLRADVEAGFLAEAMLSVLYTAITSAVISPQSSAPLDTQVTTMVALLCHGLESDG